MKKIISLSILIICCSNNYNNQRIEYFGTHKEAVNSVTKLCDGLEPNAKNMLLVCEYLGVKYPRIVTSQALLESGHFKSRIFREYNNPFGLYDSSKKDYYHFDNWVDAVQMYRMSVENKNNNNEDYYLFLKNLPYALDKDYVNKVKLIEKNLDKYI